MKKSKLFLILSSTCLALSVSAQTSAYEGLQLSAGATLGTATLKNRDTTDGTFSNEGKSFVSTRIGASYGYKINDKFVLTAGLNYDLSSPEINEKLDNAQRTEKQKSHMSFSIEPGYLINQSSLVYAKVSKHKMDIDYHRSFITGGLAGQTATASSSHSGTGFGIGYKTMLTSSIGAGFEIERIKYDTATPVFTRSGGTTSNTNSFKPSVIISTASIFYKF